MKFKRGDGPVAGVALLVLRAGSGDGGGQAGGHVRQSSQTVAIRQRGLAVGGNLGPNHLEAADQASAGVSGVHADNCDAYTRTVPATMGGRKGTPWNETVLPPGM